MRHLSSFLMGITLTMSASILHAGMVCPSNKLCIVDSSPYVIDGDTLLFGMIKYRAWGVDAPESDQPYGQESRECLSEAAHAAAFTLEDKGSSYDRRVVRISRIQSRGDGTVQLEDIALELLRNGCAWHEWHYAPNASNYAVAEGEARARKVGLWAQDNPVAPWDWRKQQRGKE